MSKLASGGACFDIGSAYGGPLRGPRISASLGGPNTSPRRAPRTGHIVGYGGPFDSFQETGPLTRRTEDLGLLLPILAGPDDWDALMAPVPLGDPANVDLKSLRVAFYARTG